MTVHSRIAQTDEDSQIPHWTRIHRIGFRFCFLYFGLYCISTTLGGLYPSLRVDDEVGLATLWPIRQITFWTDSHLFGAKLPLVYRDSGSDDKTFDWVFTFCLLVFSIFTTAIWSLLDRKRQNYGTMQKWFRLVIRLLLSSEILYFGMAKVIPIQMPEPSLTTLLMPIGDLSIHTLLWRSIGAFPAYEIFAGCAEMLARILLLFQRTTMIGALVCLADMIEVWMLKMTYDVAVKLYSFHLLLLALVLLSPEFSRLADFCFRNRVVRPSKQPRLFNSHRANEIAVALQVVFGVWLIGRGASVAWREWQTEAAATPSRHFTEFGMSPSCR